MPKLLDILLQRNDTSVPWGFQVRTAGGPGASRRPIISSVTFGTLAAQYLNAGDRILEIEKRAAESLGQSEIEGILGSELARLQLLVEKLPVAAGSGAMRNRVAVVEPQKKVAKSESFNEVVTERQCVREKEADGRGVKHSTKIWLRESNRNPSLGEYDLEVNFERTKYREKTEPWAEPWVPDFGRDFGKSRNLKRIQAFSENFDKIFKEKIGEWLETNMLGANESRGLAIPEPGELVRNVKEENPECEEQMSGKYKE